MQEARLAAENKAKEEAAAAARALADAKEQSEALVGKQVEIGGLKARPEANGLVGYVLSASDNGRCTVAVKINEQLEQLALRPVNLRPVD